MTQQEFRDKFTSGHMGDKLDYKQRLNEIADFIYENSLKFKGVSDLATINGLADVTNLDSYKLSDAGTLTAGSLAVTAGDIVYYDAETSAWLLLVDVA